MFSEKRSPQYGKDLYTVILQFTGTVFIEQIKMNVFIRIKPRPHEKYAYTRARTGAANSFHTNGQHAAGIRQSRFIDVTN